MAAQPTEEREDGDAPLVSVSEPETNPEVYKDVTQLLNVGFLTSGVSLGGQRFVFKSLNHHEISQINLRTGFEYGQKLPENYWGLFLGFMVLFVRGLNVLADRENHLHMLSETFDDLPWESKQKLIRNLSELNRRASDAIMLVEAYTTESYSRWRWAQVRDLDMTAPALTGIAGTEILGLNWAQLTWRALNHYEDMKHEQDVAWENAKFIGGCFVGKGMQSIHSKDAERKRKEKEERFMRKNSLLQYVVNGIPFEETKNQTPNELKIVARTVEELADQLKRDLKGEKDWHDRAIESYIQRAERDRERLEDEKSELRKKQEEFFNGQSIVGSTTLGATTEQIEKMQVEDKMRERLQNLDILDNPDKYDLKREQTLEKHGVIKKTWRGK